MIEYLARFLNIVFWSLYVLGPLLITLALMIVSLGLLVGRIEKWSIFDAAYWAFITGTTVGYGDIRPLKKRSKIISILIALLGLIFPGFLVAIAINTASMVIDELITLEIAERFKQDGKPDASERP